MSIERRGIEVGDAQVNGTMDGRNGVLLRNLGAAATYRGATEAQSRDAKSGPSDLGCVQGIHFSSRRRRSFARSCAGQDTTGAPTASLDQTKRSAKIRESRQGKESLRRESPERAQLSLVGVWGTPNPYPLCFPPREWANVRKWEGRTAVRPYESGNPDRREDLNDKLETMFGRTEETLVRESPFGGTRTKACADRDGTYYAVPGAG